MYVAVILLGLGGATLMVISLSMIALLIGKYSVRLSLSLSLSLSLTHTHTHSLSLSHTHTLSPSLSPLPSLSS